MSITFKNLPKLDQTRIIDPLNDLIFSNQTLITWKNRKHGLVNETTIEISPSKNKFLEAL
jgi:hypothetical protein